MGTWQVQEAKQRFSEVLREAVGGAPQVITKHGEEVAVVLSMDVFRRLSAPQVEFSEYLIHGPQGDDLEIVRDRSPMRVVEFDELP